MSKWDSNEEIQLFREYLKIPSVHPNINYGKQNNRFYSTRDKNILEKIVEIILFHRAMR